MIESNLDGESGHGHIVVCPNMSTDWETTKLFLWAFAFIVLMISSFFVIIGAWMILPFAGIELLALVGGMYWVSHKCYRQQVIHIEDDNIRVEQGSYAPTLTWNTERFWTKLIVYKSTLRGHPNRLILRGRKQQIEIGAFLNEEDKKKLIITLRGIVRIVN